MTIFPSKGRTNEQQKDTKWGLRPPFGSYPKITLKSDNHPEITLEETLGWDCVPRK